MLSASVIVWDRKFNPPDAPGVVLCWQSYAQNGSVFSVPRYLEDHAERLRAKYLAFIHDLGESCINGKRIVDHLTIEDGFSYWWMTLLAEKSPFKSPGIYDCLRLMALEEMLLERKPSDLIFHSADRDVAQAMQQLCRNLRITFIWQRPSKRSRPDLSPRRLYRALPFSVQGLISLRHLVLRWPLRKLKKPQWFSDNNAIFLCSYFVHLDLTSCAQGHFYSRQWETLPKCLHESGRRSNWIQHFLFSPVVPDTSTGVAWLQRFNCDANRQGYHAFLDTYLTWGVVARVLKRWVKLNVAAWRLRFIQSVFYPEGSAVWLWPILRKDYMASLNGPTAMSNSLWMELFDAALKDLPQQKLGLYLCEGQGWERAFLHAWKKHRHGKIIGVPHSTVPFWHLYNFDDPRSLASQQKNKIPLPDCLAVNGAAAQRAFVEAGYPVGQLVEVEALRYLNLSGMAEKRSIGTRKSGMVRQSELKPPEVKILVLGEMTPTSMHNFLRLLEDSVKLLPASYSFTFKPHPAFSVCLEDYPSLQADETSDALDRILGEYDIALSTNSTSAAVDAYVAGLPVIIGLDGGELNLSPLRGQTDVLFVSSPEELAEALKKVEKNKIRNKYGNDFFFLDSELPRWKQLLETP